MRKFLLAALLALPLLALAPRSASADGCCNFCSPTVKLNIGCMFKCWCSASCSDCCSSSCCWNPCCKPCGSCCNSCGGGCGGGCGYAAPWYSYWPTDAHFMTPAPTGYPYWPSPMTSGMGHAAAGYGGGAPYCGNNWQAPQAPPMPYGAPAVQPCGYSPQAPSYWYPH
jgi:hypothetical protein